MAQIFVCPLSRVEQVASKSGAGALVTLLNPPHQPPRVPTIAPASHLVLGVSDIVSALDGHALPEQAHVESLLDFLRRWEQSRPLVIHCYAGVSRSTAAAFIALCALTPLPEMEIARELRRLSPSATPNSRLVALADALLSREGRMTQAIAAIGRGRDCFEGEVFCMETA